MRRTKSFKPFPLSQSCGTKPTSPKTTDAGLPSPRVDGSVNFTPRESVAARAGFLAPKATRRLALTATPMPDRVRDLWAQFDIVEPGVAGKYWDWARKFCGAYEAQYGMDDRGASNLGTLQAFCQQRTSVVRSEEVYDLLPPVRRMTTYLSAGELTRSEPSRFPRKCAALPKKRVGAVEPRIPKRRSLYLKHV